MYKGKKVSVVFGTYREKKTIKKVIDGFWQTGFVDEVVVVNNNAQGGTDGEVKKTKAKLLYEKRQGYGYAYITALKNAEGDIIVTSEPDGSFLPKDLERLLVYSSDFDVVLGSRTSLIPSLMGAGMGVIRKFANVIEAKTIEVFFNTNALTDVGCTYKLFSKSAIEKLLPFCGEGGRTVLLNTKLTLLVVREKIPFVEIPITYLKRTGKSAIVGTTFQTIKWAVIIQSYILFFWLRELASRIISGRDRH